MKDFIRRKKNRSGASLAEMLATVLIMSLVMLAVTSGIAASQRVYRQVRQKADAQTLMSTTINAIAGKLYYSYVWSYSSTPSEISDSRKGIGYEQTSVRPSVPRTTEKTGTVDWIFSEGEGYIRIGNMTGSNNSTETTNTASVYPIVTDKTQSLQQYAVLKDNQISYNNGCYTFTVQVVRDEMENGTTNQIVVETQTAQIRTALSLD